MNQEVAVSAVEKSLIKQVPTTSRANCRYQQRLIRSVTDKVVAFTQQRSRMWCCQQRQTLVLTCGSVCGAAAFTAAQLFQHGTSVDCIRMQL